MKLDSYPEIDGNSALPDLNRLKQQTNPKACASEPDQDII